MISDLNCQGTDIFDNISSATWSIIWFAVNNFIPMWLLLKSADIKYFFQKLIGLSKMLDIDVSWTSNYLFIYLSSLVFGLIITITDILYLNHEYEFRADLCLSLTPAFVLLWFQYYALDVSMLLFFWMTTHVLTEALSCTCQEVTDLTKSGATKDKSQNVKSMVLSGVTSSTKLSKFIKLSTISWI